MRFLSITFVVTITFGLVHGAILHFSNNSVSLKNSVIPSPPFALGNLNFPVLGTSIFGSGCNAIEKIEKSESFNTNSTSNIIVFVGHDPSNYNCFKFHHVFECQLRHWCSGVVVEEPFFNPAGLDMWSIFDKKRDRSEYQVPLVEITTEDFNLWKQLITEAIKENVHYTVELTNDSNPWEKMFKSPEFIAVVQVLCTAWSCGCLIFAIIIIWKKNKELQDHQPKGTHQPSKYRFRLPLKIVCLYFHILTHSCRIVFRVDAFWSNQIFPYLTSFFMISFSMIFQMVSNVLLSFVIHEITTAHNNIDVMKKVFYAYLLVAFLIGFDLTLSALCGLLILPSTPFFLVKAMFYVALYYSFGFWYLRVSQLFFQKTSKGTKLTNKTKTNSVKITQTLSTTNAIAMIVCASVLTLVNFRSVYGNPTGFFIVSLASNLTSQVASFIEILLFGGVVINTEAIKNAVLKSISNPKKDSQIASRLDGTSVLI